MDAPVALSVEMALQTAAPPAPFGDAGPPAPSPREGTLPLVFLAALLPAAPLCYTNADRDAPGEGPLRVFTPERAQCRKESRFRSIVCRTTGP